MRANWIWGIGFFLAFLVIIWLGYNSSRPPLRTASDLVSPEEPPRPVE